MALTATIAGGALRTPAQEALRQSLAGEDAAERIRRLQEDQPYNVRWGDLKARFGASFGAEWNDNVNQTDADPFADFILRPSVNVDLTYPIGKANVLHLFSDFGYEKYIDHPELDRWNVKPGSSLSFDIYGRDVKINVHERFTYDQSPSRDPAVSGTASFGGLDNDAGVLATIDLHDVIQRIGYDYVVFDSTSASGYNYLDRQSHNFLAQTEMQVHPAVNVGVELGGGLTDYDQDFLNDNLGLSGGAYVRWRVSEHIAVNGRGGYVRYSFSDNPGGGAPPDFNGYYLAFNLSHRVNEWLQYGFTAEKAITLGVNSNLEDRWSLSLGPEFKVIRNVALGANLSYDSGEEKLGGRSQEFTRYGFGVSASWQMMEKVSARLEYGFYDKQSNLAGFDYRQNRIACIFSYQF